MRMRMRLRLLARCGELAYFFAHEMHVYADCVPKRECICTSELPQTGRVGKSR